MKCFVTGASGFVGANLVHELNARGHEVKIIAREESDLRGLSPLYKKIRNKLRTLRYRKVSS